MGEMGYMYAATMVAAGVAPEEILGERQAMVCLRAQQTCSRNFLLLCRVHLPACAGGYCMPLCKLTLQSTSAAGQFLRRSIQSLQLMTVQAAADEAHSFEAIGPADVRSLLDQGG